MLIVTPSISWQDADLDFLRNMRSVSSSTLAFFGSVLHTATHGPVLAPAIMVALEGRQKFSFLRNLFPVSLGSIVADLGSEGPMEKKHSFTVHFVDDSRQAFTEEDHAVIVQDLGCVFYVDVAPRTVRYLLSRIPLTVNAEDVHEVVTLSVSDAVIVKALSNDGCTTFTSASATVPTTFLIGRVSCPCGPY